MKNKKIKPLPALTHVTARGRSNYLLRMLEKQQSLLEQVRNLLPAPVADHCLHARIDGTLLILHTDSSAWMTRLRFHGPHLVQALRPIAPQLTAVKTRILISTTHPEPERRGSKLSASSAKSIQHMAEFVSDDKLRAALIRLGRTGICDQEEA